jgi:hypothetical protein
MENTQFHHTGEEAEYSESESTGLPQRRAGLRISGRWSIRSNSIKT